MVSKDTYNTHGSLTELSRESFGIVLREDERVCQSEIHDLEIWIVFFILKICKPPLKN